MVNKEDIIARLTPYDVYGNTLLKSGQGFKMICPFHNEKTPSFRIYSHDLSFHCFGCGKTGSAFQYRMDLDNISFPEAVKLLADKAGIAVSDGKSKYSRLFAINKEAQRFYTLSLLKNEQAMAYLTNERRLTKESIERFRLGCTNSIPVTRILREKGTMEDEMLKTGIAISKDNGLRDVFWKRIIFPIIFRGEVRGFGGRLVGEGEPKYLNSPASPIFQKGKLLYGLDAPSIKRKGFAIVVEGYFDVIMAHQCGFSNTVAPLGTSLTEDHVDILEKYCDRVILVFDGDRAGGVAAERTAKLFFDRKMSGSVVILPDGEDPDSFLKKGGPLDSLIQTAMPFSVYLAKRFPDTRKMVFNALLKRGRDEISEFLACMGSKEETDAFKELSARYFMDNLLKGATVVTSRDGIVVKRQNDYLVVFNKGRFLFWNKINGDYKEQAENMVKTVLKLRGMRKRVTQSREIC